MIDELQMIKDIVGDLSAVGGWVAGGVILYKFIVSMTWIVGGGWLIKTLAQMVYNHSKADITRQEADRIQAGNVRDKANYDARTIELNSRLERVRHMYKLLKEAKESKDESS